MDSQWQTTHQAEFSNPKTRTVPVPANVKYNQHGFPKDQFKHSAIATRDSGTSRERSTLADREGAIRTLQVVALGRQLIRITTTRRHSRRPRRRRIGVRLPHPPARNIGTTPPDTSSGASALHCRPHGRCDVG